MDSSKVVKGILLTLSFIVIVVLTPPGNIYMFPGYILILIYSFIIFRISFKNIVKKSIILFPFVIFMGIFLPFKRGNTPIFTYHHITIFREGAIFFLATILKGWISLMSLTVLSSVFSFPQLIKGWKKLKIPKILIALLSFMYRYMYLLSNMAKNMEMARNMRDFGNKKGLQIKAYSNIIGLLFIRAYEKGEMIYSAMRLRGFDEKNSG